jgi:hypothetical protein
VLRGLQERLISEQTEELKRIEQVRLACRVSAQHDQKWRDIEREVPKGFESVDLYMS